MAAQGHVQRVAAALQRPRPGYFGRIDRTRRAVAPRSIEAARQLEVFAGRIADLTIEELRELHDETFRVESPLGIGLTLRRLAREPAVSDEARRAIDTLAPLLQRLDADRNPFAYVVRALCCVLLADGTGESAYQLVRS